MANFPMADCYPTFSDGIKVPNDGRFHTDPCDPMTSIQWIELWFPPGVLISLGGGSTSRLGLLSDGTVLKYPLTPDDTLKGLEIEDAILSSLGSHERLVQYLGKTQHGLRFKRALHGDSATLISQVRPEWCKHPLGQVLGHKWSTQAAEAVAFIHTKGVLHCDIHPNNFLADDNLTYACVIFLARSLEI